jgi:hypothetical protein
MESMNIDHEADEDVEAAEAAATLGALASGVQVTAAPAVAVAAQLQQKQEQQVFCRAAV